MYLRVAVMATVVGFYVIMLGAMHQ